MRRVVKSLGFRCLWYSVELPNPYAPNSSSHVVFHYVPIDRIWGIWGSCYDLPKTIFCLGFMGLGVKVSA